jgi:uncharacterized protein YqeY
MTLKERINVDFVTAFKAKNDSAKSALSMLKAKITETEKANKNNELTDAEVLKVILAAQKQRKQSIEEFSKAGRTELVEKEIEELKALEPYLPKMMSEEEIRVNVTEIMSGIPKDNVNKLIGMTTGTMNKKFPGQFDNSVLQSIIKELI